MSADLFYTYLSIVLFISFIIWIWFFGNRSERLLNSICKKYPLWVVIHYKFSFGSGWESKVDTEDIPIIKKYRKTNLLYYVVLVLMFGLIMLTSGKYYGPGEVIYFG